MLDMARREMKCKVKVRDKGEGEEKKGGIVGEMCVHWGGA